MLGLFAAFAHPNTVCVDASTNVWSAAFAQLPCIAAVRLSDMGYDTPHIYVYTSVSVLMLVLTDCTESAWFRRISMAAAGLCKTLTLSALVC